MQHAFFGQPPSHNEDDYDDSIKNNDTNDDDMTTYLRILNIHRFNKCIFKY
jgi:hypothetical protein